MISCKSLVTVNAEIKDQPIAQVSLDEYANVQKRKDAIYQDPDLALGLSISGGGSRAEYYGLGVLMGLEELALQKDSVVNLTSTGTANKRNFLNDVDYFSTVSGGGFAGGYYLGARKNNLIAPGQSLRAFWLSRDEVYKTNIPYNAKVGNLFTNYKKYEKDKKHPSFPDMVDEVILQKGNKDLSGKPINSLVLNDFFAKKGEQATMPMFVPSGTIYNNSERIPFMPHIISQMKILKSEMPRQDLSGDPYNDGFTLPLKYAIAASSGFPGLVPQVKLKVAYKRYEKDTKDYYVRIIDGGVVDNLGFTTLVELLKYDNAADNKKRALIIDCSGEGLVERYAPNKLGQVSLLKHSLMFTLQSKYATFDRDIVTLMKWAGIPDPENSYLKIGITDLRAIAQAIRDEADSLSDEARTINSELLRIKNNPKLTKRYEDELKELRHSLDSMETQELFTDATLRSSQVLDSLRRDEGKRLTKKQKQKRWNDFYEMFERMLDNRIQDYNLVLDDYPGKHHNMDLLKTADFAKFKENDKALLLLLYELASQVDTNVELPSDRERSILILAGRYTVFVRRDKILDLYAN